MRVAIIILLLLISGCINKSQEKKEIKVINTSPVINEIFSDSQTTTKEQLIENKNLVFKYQNDTLLQTLNINFLTDEEIFFELTTKNTLSGKVSSIKGKAKGDSDVDPEIDEDDEGNTYAAQNFTFEKDCWLSIRVSIESRDKVKVKEANCESLHDKTCPFGSLGLLKKTN